MTLLILPAVWLIISLVGLPQLSETVYTPSLPDIAHALQTSDSMVEYTLTIYLFGFAIGTLFWGKISDRFGRKPCIIAGLLIFIAGCLSCYASTTISMLMISRFIQAFGGSIGSVLGQAVCRDAFHGPALGKVYSSIGTALALFPAIGPIIGGVIAEYHGWNSIFLFLTVVAILLTIITAIKLPETHDKNNRKKISLLNIISRLVSDKKVIAYGIIVGATNGILFSYFAEGSFYLIQGLGLSPSQYGFTFMIVAAGSMTGGIISRKLQNSLKPIIIMRYGLYTITFSTLILTLIAVTNQTIFQFPATFMIISTLLSQMITSAGICIAANNALALALVDYKDAIGTASSLFGFFYYCLVSFFTLLMGYLHDGTLLIMPIYFLLISLLMIAINKYYLKKAIPN